jgi:hypothetical protein
LSTTDQFLNPRRVLLRGTLAIAVVALAVPQVAGAAAPRDSNLRIVPNVSIGEIRLGQSALDARAAWGGGVCENPGPYENGESRRFNPYGGPGVCSFAVRRRGSAGFWANMYRYDAHASEDEPDVSVVQRISISASHLGTRYVQRRTRPYLQSFERFAFVAPYTSFRTAKGIRLGSTLQALRRAHPVRRMGEPNGIFTFDFQVYGLRAGKTLTTFSVASGRVFKIEILPYAIYG